MIETADRISAVKEYYFSAKLREIEKMILSGKPIINIGIGSPDLFPDPSVLNALQSSLQNKNAHKYQSYQGLVKLRRTMANFYKRHYDVDLNPHEEILPLIGSKEGIAHISLAYLNKEDKVLIPNPGYPTYHAVTGLVQAQTIYYNLQERNNWQPDFNQLQKLDLKQIKLIWLSYPHMPTGAKAEDQTFVRLIELAKKYDILLINDNPYSLINNVNPKSILKYPFAKDVAIELNSLSKSFNMAGWRIGMACGSAKLLRPVLQVKSNFDSGIFYGIQLGAITALKLPQQWFEKLGREYHRRRKLVEKLALKLGASFDNNQVGLFLWAKIPKGEKSSEDFIEKLLHQHYIFASPGTVFGSNGEGYFRLSLCVKEDVIQEAIDRIK